MNLKKVFYKEMFGLNKCFRLKFIQRLEIFDNYSFDLLPADKWIVLLKELNVIIPKNKSIKDRLLFNIFFLDLILSYRGWRHLKGLPVRGQRTWTNAWTTYRNNLTLREYKIIIAKRLYGNISTENLNVTYLAEQINLLWKLQWENEWREAKKKRLVSSKSSFKVTNIDLYSMSKGIIDTSGNKKNKKKIKNQFSKNLFTLGFDPGFTKALIKANYISNLKKQKSKQNRINLIFSKSIIKSKKK